MNERDIFLAALEIADPAQRAAFVEQACGADAALRARVEALLQAHAQTSQFLETPAVVDPLLARTIVTDAPQADDSVAGRIAAEAEFRKYLQPTTRAGWLGRLGHYEIETILGRGAFGIVAKAFDEKLHRVVAIKMLSPDLAGSSPPRKRFLREARTAAAMRHENVVGIYAVEEEPIPYLVMEYIPGPTLSQKLHDNGPLELPEILNFSQQIAAGLAAAHAVHLIHRDIKPSNILLEENLGGRLKITDFGLARAVDDASLTTSGMIAGTPMYMSPEQAKGETLDHRTDLFSLGSVMYQMTSGRPPFRATTTIAVLRRVCDETPRPIQDIIAETPDWLCVIIDRLLAKDAKDRYQTAQEVSDLLVCCQEELRQKGQVTCVPMPGRADQKATPTKPVVTAGPPHKSAVPGLSTQTVWKLVAGLIGLVALVTLTVMMQIQRHTPSGESVSGQNQAANSSTDPQRWHGWPADAPEPAIAPFNADRARKHQEEWAKSLQVPVEFTNSIGMTFRLIPPGEFTMGSSDAEIQAALPIAGNDTLWQDCIKSEGPQHKVVLTQPFYLGVHEVTQSQYQQIMENNPSYFAATGEWADFVANLETSNFPVEGVSWDDATEFCRRLSDKEQLKPGATEAAKTRPADLTAAIRLPVEAEWEFACRAGTVTQFYTGNQLEDLKLAGWWTTTSGDRTHAVGELQSNAFGLYDMHGNVWEWPLDAWNPNWHASLAGHTAVDPFFPPDQGPERMTLGGNYSSAALACRSASRCSEASSYSSTRIGFRVVVSVDAVRRSR